VNVLSLFDGISGAQVALKRSGIQVDKYYSSEIDKYAMQVTQHHFPDTIQLGDINEWRNWDIDFSKIDFLVGGFPCFGAGTKIITSDGYKNIEDIKEGDLVLTHEKRFRKVINTNCKKGKVCKLKAEGILETITTMNHPYYVRKVSKTWGNENGNYKRDLSDPYWEEVNNLERSVHYIGIPINKTEKNKRNLTIDLCWLMGRYVADGYIQDGKRKNRKNSYVYKIVICVGKDKIDLFQQKMKNFKYTLSENRTVYKCIFSSKELNRIS
jgi:hypothetical protein